MDNIIVEDLVCLDLKANDKYGAINKLAKLLDDSNRLVDYTAYVNSVIEREELTSTGIGFKIAIPHGKCAEVKKTSIAFGRIEEGLDWGSLDNEKVHLVILLAIPCGCDGVGDGQEHLKILASLSRKLIHEDFRNTLFSCQNPKEISELLNSCL